MSSEPTHLLQCAPTQKQSVKKEKTVLQETPWWSGEETQPHLHPKKKKPKRIGKRTGKRPITTLTLLFFFDSGWAHSILFFSMTRLRPSWSKWKKKKKGQPFERTYPPTHLLARVTKHQGVCVCSFAHEPPVESRKLC